jgi:hypothetical protein
MDFGWGIWAAIIGSVVFVALFLGPGMWSSSTDFLFVTLWRQWRERRRAKHGIRPDVQREPTTPSAK